MKNLLVFLICFISSTFLFSQEQKRLALVIGNSNYDSIAKLANPVNDAKLIAKTLDYLDFEVILATDLNEDNFMKKIIEFRNKRKDYDIGFVYYAGHGVQINGQNYLLPTEQNFDEEWKIKKYAINVNDIMEYLTSITDQVNILILDACRNNPWESKFRSVKDPNNGGLAKMSAPTGSLIAFSTAAGRVAADGDGENSIYSKSLVKYMVLENTTLDQVFRNVRKDVLKESNNMQRPIESSQLTGQAFYLVQTDYSKLIEEIQKDIDDDNLIKALEKSTSLVEKNKNIHLGYEKRAEIYIKLNKYYNAIEDYYNCIKLNPEKLEYMFLIGNTYFKKAQHYKEWYGDDIKNAIKAYSDCIDLDCSNDAYMMRGRSHSINNETKANEDYKKFYELKPKHPYGNYLMSFKQADTLGKIKFLERAIEFDLLSVNPTILSGGEKLVTDGYYKMAIQYLKLDKKSFASNLLEKAIKLNPNDLMPYYFKLEFYLSHFFGEDPGASNLYSLKSVDLTETIIKIKEIGKDDARASNILARYYGDLNELELAKKYAEISVALDKNDQNLFRLGNIELQLGNYNTSKDIFEKLLENVGLDIQRRGIRSNLSLSYYNLAQEIVDEGDFKNALLTFQKALKITNDNILNLKKLGLYDYDDAYLLLHKAKQTLYISESYWGLKDIKNAKKYNIEAEKVFLEGVETFPNYSPTINQLALYYFNEQKYDNATEMIKKSILADPDNFRNYILQTKIYFKQKEFGKGIETIDTGIEKMTIRSVNPFFYKIGLLTNLERYDECLLVISELEKYSKENNLPNYKSLPIVKSFIHFNLGNQIESFVEITNAIKLFENAIQTKLIYDFFPSLDYILNGLEMNIEWEDNNEYETKNYNNILPNGKMFMLNSNITNYDSSHLFILYRIRANIFKSYGLDNFMCEDYNTALNLTDDKEKKQELELLISENCN